VGPLEGAAERLLRVVADPARRGRHGHPAGEAHAADLRTQDKFGARYLRYWVNEPEGKVFCLIEAPSAEAATAVHKEAHGLLADEIFAVEEGR
jgi:hypothetical protein